MRKDGSVYYTMGDSLPPDAVEITVDQLQNIPAPTETSDDPGATDSRKPLPIEQSLQFMLDEKAGVDPKSLGGKISIGDAIAWAEKNK